MPKIPLESDGVVIPEEPAHQPCQQQDCQHHPRQAGGEHQEVQPASPSSMGWYSPRAIITEEEVRPGITRLMPQRAPQKLYHQKLGSR